MDERYPSYGLYAYGEGRTFRATKQLQFSGIPVLFVPGNAGSYKQGEPSQLISWRNSFIVRSIIHLVCLEAEAFG